MAKKVIKEDLEKDAVQAVDNESGNPSVEVPEAEQAAEIAAVEEFAENTIEEQAVAELLAGTYGAAEDDSEDPEEEEDALGEVSVDVDSADEIFEESNLDDGSQSIPEIDIDDALINEIQMETEEIIVPEKNESTNFATAHNVRAVERALAKDKRAVHEERRNLIDDKIVSTWMIIRRSYQRGDIIPDAKIVGAKTLVNPNSKVGTPCALVKFGDTNIIGYIPFFELWPQMPDSMARKKTESNAAYEKRILRAINDMSSVDADAVIPVVVTEARYANNIFTITASRRMAMLQYITAAYKSPMVRSRRKEPIKVGDVVSATVVTASLHTVMLNVYGVDVLVNKMNLTPRHIPIARDYYKPGNEIFVRVSAISWPEDDKHLVHYRSDHAILREQLAKYAPGSREYRRASQLLATDALHRIPEIIVNGRDVEIRKLYARNGAFLTTGTTTRAIVTYVYFGRSNGKYTIWLWLPDLEMAALSYKKGGFTVKEGDVVDFEYRGLSDKKTPYLEGEILFNYGSN